MSFAAFSNRSQRDRWHLPDDELHAVNEFGLADVDEEIDYGEEEDLIRRLQPKQAPNIDGLVRFFCPEVCLG